MASVRATWKGLVLTRVEQLRTELALTKSAEDDPVVARIVALLEQAERLASEPSGLGNVLAWLTGTEIERAWAALHEAGQLLLLRYDDETVRAKAPDLLATVNSRIGRDDPRRARYESVLAPLWAGDARAQPAAVSTATREQLRQIRKDLDAISDDAHGRIRNFRNVALAVTILLSCAMVAIALDSPQQPWLPVTYGKAPWASLWQIILVGALGGLLAAVVALRQLEGFAGPYGLPIVMAALKVPTGALTGLLGALWMQNNVFGALSPHGGRTILAYVAVFGYAQQAFTTFADRQAKQLLGEASPARPS